MSIKFKGVTKINPSDRSQPPKYYAQVVSTGDMTIRELAKEIATISTVSTTDTIAVLEAFLETVPKTLTDGKIVRLGDFGSFSISVNSEGVESEADVSVNQIKKTNVKFRPGKIFKQAISLAEFKKTS